MRNIVKVEPKEYSNFIRKEQPANWEQTAPIRQSLREHMLAEQNMLCAYTEIRLQSDSHIDHFKRKHLFQELELTYTNLFVAYKHSNYGAEYKDVHLVKDQYDNMYHPYFDNLDGMFSYDPVTGKIFAIDNTDKKAEFTISAFNLNDDNLKQRRMIAAYTAVAAFEAKLPIEETIAYLGEFESLVRYIYS